MDKATPAGLLLGVGLILGPGWLLPRLATVVPAARRSAERGLQRYLDDRVVVRESPLPVAYMDYTCWGSSYGLVAMATALDPTLVALDPALRAAVIAEADHLQFHWIDDAIKVEMVDPDKAGARWLTGRGQLVILNQRIRRALDDA